MRCRRGYGVRVAKQEKASPLFLVCISNAASGQYSLLKHRPFLLDALSQNVGRALDAAPRSRLAFEIPMSVTGLFGVDLKNLHKRLR